MRWNIRSLNSDNRSIIEIWPVKHELSRIIGTPSVLSQTSDGSTYRYIIIMIEKWIGNGSRAPISWFNSRSNSAYLLEKFVSRCLLLQKKTSAQHLVLKLYLSSTQVKRVRVKTQFSGTTAYVQDRYLTSSELLLHQVQHEVNCAHAQITSSFPCLPPVWLAVD